MNLERLQAQGRLRGHKTNQTEIQQLLRLVDRDIADAQVKHLSEDRRFLIAYEAALALATIPLYCAGYETHGQGHHWTTFQCLPEIMGADVGETSEYFDLCRTKRNISAYDRSGQISQAEAEELLSEAKAFKTIVLSWLTTEYPHLIE
jgi:hypothetical protein